MKKPIDRFLEKVKKTETCWLFVSVIRSNGYGLFWLNGKNWNAHRASYFLHKGEIPLGKWVLHACDNNVCVNPEHLYLGDRIQNAKDMVERGRSATGENHGSKTHPDAFSKPKRFSDEECIIILKSNLSAFDLAEKYKVHYATIYRARYRADELLKQLNP